MRTYLFDRARMLLLNGFVIKRAETPGNIYFEVKNEKGVIYNVTIGYDLKLGRGNDFMLNYSCDCQYMSVQGIKHKQQCSHILACVGYLIGLRKEQTESEVNGKDSRPEF